MGGCGEKMGEIFFLFGCVIILVQYSTSIQHISANGGSPFVGQLAVLHTYNFVESVVSRVWTWDG